MKFRRCDEAEALSQAGQRRQDFDPAQLPPGRDGRFSAASVRLMFVPLAVAFVLLIAPLGGDAAAAEREPLAGLHRWAATTQDSLGRNAGDRAVERRIAWLRRLVPAVAGPLRPAAPGRQRAALRHAREALGRSLELVAARLDFRRRWFFFTAYQAELERLARLAGMLRTPTGVAQPPVGRPPTPAEAQAAVLQDSDGDGVLDLAERDDDNDGRPDFGDAFDAGWGIPDALQAREDGDGDADEDGRPDGGSWSPCVFVVEAVPSFRSAREAAGWLRRAERQRGCRVPRSAAVVRPSRSAPRAAVTVGGVRLAGARLSAGSLSVAVRARQRATLRLVGRRGGRVLFRARLRVGRSGGVRRVRVRRLPSPGRDHVAVEVTSGGKRARGWLALRTGPPPRPLPVVADASADRLELPPRPLPVVAHAAAERLQPPLRPRTVSDCSVPPTRDTDGDGVPDCTELAGFEFGFYPPGSTTATKRHTSSDPNSQNSDADSITVSGTTFALGDYAEWETSGTGGISDPNTPDSDGDSLGDVEELHRRGTAANMVDSDADSTGPDKNRVADHRLYDAHELTGSPQATSPTLADSDGDSYTDYAELLLSNTNPRVSQVPKFTVAPSPTAPGIQIAIPASQSKQTVSSTFQDQQSSSSFTDQTTNETVHESSGGFDASIQFGCGIGSLGAPRAEGCIGFGQATISGGAHWVNSTTTTHQTTYSTQSQHEAQQAYQQSTTVELDPTGTLSATFDVHNSGTVAVQIRNLGVLATAQCLPAAGAGAAPAGCLNPGRETTVATLTPVNAPQAGITLSPGQTQTYQFSNDKVPTPLLQSLLANPGNLSFTPANYELWTARGEQNYASLFDQTIDSNTGQLTIDYGNGQANTYMVATNVDRNWGSPTIPAGATPPEFLDQILQIPHETTLNPAPAQQRPVLSGLNGVKSRPLQGDGSRAVPAAWFAFGSAHGLEDPNIDFDRINLRPGQTLYLAYVRDADGDALWDREEVALASSDQQQDTDRDGATGPRPGGNGNYASDYFESRVGWKVPYPSEAEGFQVYSSPIFCDADQDFSPDGPGGGNEQLFGRCPASNFAPELARRTDPTNPDTNQNGILDGRDANPLQPPPQPITSGRWTGKEMQATGGFPIPGTNDWLLSDAGQSIAPPTIALCAQFGKGRNCGNATGYYRLTWTIHPDPNPFDKKPPAGRWTLRTQNPSDPVPVQWLSANLEEGESGQGGTYQLYFHIPGNTNMANADLRFTNRSRAVIKQLELDPVSPDEYRAAAVSSGQPNPAFAAIAFPGQGLAQAKGVTADGPQGIRIDGPAAGQSAYTVTAWGPSSGFDVPAGGYRAGLQLRAADNDVNDQIIATPSVTRGADQPAQEAVGCCDGLTQLTDTRYPLAAGRVWRQDFAAAKTPQTFNLVFEQRTSQQNLSFPVAVSPSAGGLWLDNVVLDRTPSILATIEAGVPYSGLAFSGQPPDPSYYSLLEYVTFVSPEWAQLRFGGGPAAFRTRSFPGPGRLAQGAVLMDSPRADNECQHAWIATRVGDFGGQLWQPSSGRPQWVVTGYYAVGTTPTFTFARALVPCGPETVLAKQVYLINRPPPLGGVTVSGGARWTRTHRVKLTVQAPAGATAMTIANDARFRRARTMPVRRHVAWRLDRGRREGAHRVWVRFSGSVRGRRTVSYPIMLDTAPPVGRASARVAAPGRWRLRLSASDRTSGAAAMQLRAGRKMLRWRRLRRNIVLRAPSRGLAIRFRDRAGNVSPWIRVRQPRD
jgi:hypothetical protein